MCVVYVCVVYVCVCMCVLCMYVLCMCVLCMYVCCVCVCCVCMCCVCMCCVCVCCVCMCCVCMCCVCMCCVCVVCVVCVCVVYVCVVYVCVVYVCVVYVCVVYVCVVYVCVVYVCVVYVCVVYVCVVYVCVVYVCVVYVCVCVVYVCIVKMDNNYSERFLEALWGRREARVNSRKIMCVSLTWIIIIVKGFRGAVGKEALWGRREARVNSRRIISKCALLSGSLSKQADTLALSQAFLSHFFLLLHKNGTVKKRFFLSCLLHCHRRVAKEEVGEEGLGMRLLTSTVDLGLLNFFIYTPFPLQEPIFLRVTQSLPVPRWSPVRT